MYRATLSILLYVDCISQDGRIRENVELWRCHITEVSLCTLYALVSGIYLPSINFSSLVLSIYYICL